MALPYIRINFANGAIGQVEPSADGVVGLLTTATAVSDTFVLGKAYQVYRLESLEELGVNSTNNAVLYETAKDFYAEAGDGAELWVYGIASTVSADAMLNKANAHGKALLNAANGRIRTLAVAYGGTSAIDVAATCTAGQGLAEYATDTMFAPINVVFAVSVAPEDLVDLSSRSDNRVAVLNGSQASEGRGAVGILAGRIAANQVHVNIGRVKDGSLKVDTAYFGNSAVNNDLAEVCNQKGYIAFRTFVGKGGYYFSSDTQATSTSDDYQSIARRRTIDKAYRTVYNTMLNHVNDEIAVTNEGYIAPSVAKDWESEIISAVANAMTAEGELGVDPTDANDTGVKCSINYKQKVLATNKVNIAVAVKPYGYAKYIEVNLGFLVE